MRPRPLFPRLFAALALAAGLTCHSIPATSVTAKTVSFVFSDVDGRSVRLADYRGQWVLVAFWAPWCPLCKLQMPTLRQLDARPDLTVIGVGLDYDSPSAVREAVERHDLGFRVVAGGARRDPNSPHRQVGPVDYFPTSYLYDPEGEITMYIPGQVNANKVTGYMARWQGGKTAPVAVGGDRLATMLKQQYGQAGSQAYGDWRRLVDGLASVTATEKLARVNDWFNRRIVLATDQRVWQRPDYWATLGEVLGKGQGDGEDLALAKYFTLQALGIPMERLRLVYVRSQASGDPVHVVLAHFDQAGQEPVLLDSRQAEVLPASRRTDLKPVFSFNSAGAWGDAQALPEAVGGRLPMWDDTLRRARAEGFE